jgi:putative ABC transport system ATP-binding protein
VLALLRAQHRDGQTIVMVTHDPRVAAAADRLLVMEDGRFTTTGADADSVSGALVERRAAGPR